RLLATVILDQANNKMRSTRDGDRFREGKGCAVIDVGPGFPVHSPPGVLLAIEGIRHREPLLGEVRTCRSYLYLGTGIRTARGSCHDPNFAEHEVTIGRTPRSLRGSTGSASTSRFSLVI